MTFDQAKKDFAKARDKSRGKPLRGRGGSTRLIRIDDDGPETYAVRYHNSNIVLFNADGSITLTSDGFRTVSTKERLNEHGPVNVWQEKFVWYVQPTGCPDPIEFEDGMRFNAKGRLLPDGSSDPLAGMDRTVAVAQ